MGLIEELIIGLGHGRNKRQQARIVFDEPSQQGVGVGRIAQMAVNLVANQLQELEAVDAAIGRDVDGRVARSGLVADIDSGDFVGDDNSPIADTVKIDSALEPVFNLLGVERHSFQGDHLRFGEAGREFAEEMLSGLGGNLCGPEDVLVWASVFLETKTGGCLIVAIDDGLGHFDGADGVVYAIE